MVKAALVTAWPVVQLASGLSRLIAWLLLPFDRSSRLRMSASSAGLRLAVVAMLAGMSAGTVSFALTSSQASDLEGLAKSGVRSSAIVTRSLPEQHNSVEYSFIVGGRTYSGGGFADPPNPSADHLAPGDSVRIVYQPGIRQTHALAHPQQRPLDNVCSLFRWHSSSDWVPPRLTPLVGPLQGARNCTRDTTGDRRPSKLARVWSLSSTDDIPACSHAPLNTSVVRE